jgi:hypothetical protein
MASRYSMTVQFAEPSAADRSPGHAAVVVNTPDGQTYAGLGPANHDWRSLGGMWSLPRFEPQTVSPGKMPPGFSDPQNFNTVFGHKSYATHTIPISEEQAKKALAEIERIRSSNQNYNVFDANVCTTIVNQILEASGLGRDILPRILPSQNNDYLSNVESTLTANPKARVAFDGAGLAHAIAEPLRFMQKDYAFVGGGYDTPSERHGLLPSGPLLPQEPAPSFSDRFGNWPASPNGDFPVNRGQTPPTDGPSASPERYLGRRLVDGSGSSVFDTGAPAVPFVPNGPLVPQPPASFDDRYGGRGASPAAPGPVSSYPTGPARPPGPASETDPRNVRVLRSRMVQLGSASSGQSTVAYPAAPIFGLPDQSAASGDDMSDWFARWVKPLIQQ